ncbi:biotin--[acetyl-CoA-carboxylase] ligase [Lederbergia lenta]|uniref:Bifunctional ligase/repressor BirA n=1 Tax=Lederbergia lenta TaxID=1467 RepID=A0A2X4W9G3_LEDLE|nr:biotin--[acetyl-CoA-carboxylase] ligase [Lederbergia lenta]MCM3109293.1 biotin--[acetyl-CoA-carboxylase] ligase [Lederbergia lenta]MEC2324942.1 biotin--[acetyl-CoA-carboxylase] ligase [Lederbergia lenta]SQI56598.1 biotin acetyl-CoA-carboxylase ligase and biotin regulon repressor [Lederbergia lenta]
MSTSVKKQLIAALFEANNEFLSGQALAEMIGCSRTAIWKQIEELRKSGFEIEAIRKKGYRIIHKPDQLSENEILMGLETSVLGRNILYFDTIDSTQNKANEVARMDAPEGTIVIAEEQTSGRGRMAREWHSSKHKGIWMSLILRPQLPPEKAPQFTLITAIAIARAIEEVTGKEPEIKWPNDILFHGKKMTGILTELHSEADKINFIIIGIGLNVNQEMPDFPEEVREIATSLAIENGKKVSRVILLQHILKNFEKYYQLYLEKGFGTLKVIWESYVTSIGKSIIARTISGEIVGKALGITEEGVLKIQDAEGQIHYVYSADIEIKP